MVDIWKEIKSIEYKSCDEGIRDLKKNNYKLSLWIEDIFNINNFNFQNYNLPIKLAKKSVKELGFEGPAEIQDIYKEIKKSKFDLVPPEIAILSRKYYQEQPTGEWLRFATPLNSMKDSDGVPHLPKLGKALGFYFIETYWAYPKAISHPHNEFIMMIK